MPPLKFAEIVKPTLYVVDVVGDTEEEQLFTREHSDLIEEELTKALSNSDNSAHLSKLDFDFCGFDRGIFRTINRNNETREWVLKTIPTLTFEKGPKAKIKTVEAGAPPKLVRSSITLKFPTPKFGELCDIVEARKHKVLAFV